MIKYKNKHILWKQHSVATVTVFLESFYFKVINFFVKPGIKSSIKRIPENQLHKLVQEKEYLFLFSRRNFLYKGSVSIIYSEPPSKDGHCQFSTLPFNL